MRVRFYSIAILSWLVCVLHMVYDPRTAHAAEWSTQPSAHLGWEHNTNPLLTTQPHEGVSGSTISPKLDLGVSSDIWQVMGSAEAVQQRFSGGGSLDRDDRNYNLTGSYKTERSTWQLAGSKSKNSVIADEQISPDIGTVQVQKMYDLRSVNPSWTWAVNELTQLQIAYSFSHYSYVDGKVAGLNDYTARGITTQLAKWVDPNDQIFLSAGYSIFNVPSTSFESKSATYQAGVTRVFSEALRGTFAAGMRRASNEQNVAVCALSFGPICLQTVNVSQFAKQSSSVFSGSLQKQYEASQLSLSVSRTFDPSGLGGVVRTDSQNVALSRQFTSRLTGNFTASHNMYSSETGNLPGVERHYLTFSPGLTWAWTEELSVNSRYEYRHIKRVTDSQAVAANLFFLTLEYQWPKMAFSR